MRARSKVMSGRFRTHVLLERTKGATIYQFPLLTDDIHQYGRLLAFWDSLTRMDALNEEAV